MVEVSEDQFERMKEILNRVMSARRELDSLIGDNYLSPRVNIVGVHFTPLAAAVEKLRWAETQWRELMSEIVGEGQPA